MEDVRGGLVCWSRAAHSDLRRPRHLYICGNLFLHLIRTPDQHTSATAAEMAIVTALARTPTCFVTVPGAAAEVEFLLGAGVLVVELLFLPTVVAPLALDDDEWSMELMEPLDLAGAFVVVVGVVVVMAAEPSLSLLPSSMGAPTPARKPVPLLAASSAWTPVATATTSVSARARTLESFIVGECGGLSE